MRDFVIGLSVLGSCLLAAGCSRDTSAVSGRLVGNDSTMVYLEQVLPGRQVVVDSVSTDDKGYFSFKVKLPAGEPTIYNLLCKDERIPLLVSPGEKIKVHAVGSITRSYSVEGSDGSVEMKRLGEIFFEGTARLDSIFERYNNAHENLREDIVRNYRDAYYKLKRDHIAFIVSNPGSLVSLYALYQRLPNDDLFYGANNVIYYRLVADSTGKYFPTSPYVAALQKEVETMEGQLRLANLIKDKMQDDNEVDYPDLELPDMYGNMHRLSLLAGKVILLDFWTSTTADSRLLNAEMRELYDRYHSQGLEIYQVGVDRSRSEWVLAVQDQKLPWITVNDFKGSASSPVILYNVQEVPTNFIIGRSGSIEGKNVWGGELEQLIRELL